MSPVPPEAYAVALSYLPAIGPASLSRLLAEGSPQEIWGRVLDGRVRRPTRRGDADGQGDGRLPLEGAQSSALERSDARARVRSPAWSAAAATLDPEELWRHCRNKSIGVTWRGRPDYPAALIDDPEPPGILFWRGQLHWLEGRCVALVGTRRCTPDGRATAYQMGRDLAEAGVCVISGLALGIDGAAHAGALDSGSTGPVAVAASGVDRPYPRQHTDLWERVVGAGAILSETPPGAPAQAWRFPARNRIIAGLAHMVVVVESHAAGGSLLTAEAALARGVELRAVPGPVRSPASQGTNQLLYEGGGPVRHAGDILDALGLVGRWPASGARALSGLTRGQDAILEAVSVRPTTIGQIVERTGVGLGAVASGLDELEAGGWVQREGSWWARRYPAPPSGHRPH